MDRYLQQLIEDLRAATGQVPEPGEIWSGVDMDNPAEVEDVAYVEQFLDGNPQKLSVIVGVEKIVFPPPEKMTEVQSTVLYAEMIKLLEAYHFVPDFPEDLPVPVRYRVLRDQWESEQVFVGAGEVHIEFCTYEPGECPFPHEFCDCLKFEEEEDAGETYSDENGDEDLPLPF